MTVYVKLGLNESSNTRSALALGRYRLRKKHSFELVTPATSQYVNLCASLGVLRWETGVYAPAQVKAV